MQPKLVTAKRTIFTPMGEYVPSTWGGQNTSGMRPIGDRVLVLPDLPPEKTSGGVYITEQQRDRDAHAAESGILVAAGESAWKLSFDGVKPELGQRVWFERYAGSLQHGKDGEVYRLMDDRCIGAVSE
jgi:co-chaperonin GroES (HSP10)